MFSSLATRTSVQSFSISSMVRIMTMLCHRSGDSKCLPNLGEGESPHQEGSRCRALPALPQPFLNQSLSCILERSPGEGLQHITVLARAASSSRVRVELGWNGGGPGDPGQTQQTTWNTMPK